MPEALTKLRPDRDLQCYFERPSAVSALFDASETSFKLSGTWRQQFDWAVVEWNRDNVFEHPMFRNLPDGDLSGVVLTYDEERTNCIPMDSSLYPTVDWPYLRIWARANGIDEFYRVSLRDYGAPLEGSYVSAEAHLTLQGTITAGDYVGISFLTEHHTYKVTGEDTLESAAQQIVDSVNTLSAQVQASRRGAEVRLVYVGEGQSPETSTTGVDGNRVGTYGFVAGAGSESWTPQWTKFSGGESPSKWRITLDFSNLLDIDNRSVPTTSVRKMRWTYSADSQDGAFQRSEFLVSLNNWQVTGSNLTYRVASPGSRRIEDDDPEVAYEGTWVAGIGNFSGSTIRSCVDSGASLTIEYHCPLPHELYVGTRYAAAGARIEVEVDSSVVLAEGLRIPGEDVLVRLPLGQYAAGHHIVRATHVGQAGLYFYFDFLEIAHPTEALPAVTAENTVTLATDWDTDHSIALPAERTAWQIHALGFHGRANHYVGALWFYELSRPGHVYASATVDFVGMPAFSEATVLTIGWVGEPPGSETVVQHVNRIGDTAETLAKAFELELNRGYNAVRAEAAGIRLTIFARAMGELGNSITLGVEPGTGSFQLVPSGQNLSGGADGEWRTDTSASPRLNRAVRDWSRSFYIAMKNHGIDVAAAFSMELQHGDPTLEAGIAQRYPSGAPALLNTPALQTNFSPMSTSFWMEVYREMAQIQLEAGSQPYLQFGEVQWWYFPSEGSGMPFYDEYTQNLFQITYGRPLAIIVSNQVDPSLYPDETHFLPTLIGQFTSQVISHVKSFCPSCRFEALYPTDVNDSDFNTLINYPVSAWTSSTLDNIKTESFTYTIQRNLDRAFNTIGHGQSRGFPRNQRSFLVGIGDSTTAWLKEVNQAKAEGLESIVLFALDQFCLVGYALPLRESTGHSRLQG